MVMRRNSVIPERAAHVEYVPAQLDAALDVAQLFPAVSPLELDLGCGDGSFITSLAAEHPERNYFGVERLRGRVAGACRKVAARGLSNVRIIRVDIALAVACLIPAGSVDTCHVMFPDPWPKRRHRVRRTVTAELLRAIHRILIPDGLLRLTTDDSAYFEQMQAAAAAVPEFVPVDDAAGSPLPRSTFELRFVESGIPIHRLVLRKVSPAR